MKISEAAAAEKPERDRRWRIESRSPMENAFAAQLEQRLPPPPPEASSPPADAASSAPSLSDASAGRLTVDDLPPRMTVSPAANDDDDGDGALALPKGMTLPEGAEAEEPPAASAQPATAAPIAAQGPPAPKKPEFEEGATDLTAGASPVTPPGQAPTLSLDSGLGDVSITNVRSGRAATATGAIADAKPAAIKDAELTPDAFGASANSNANAAGGLVGVPAPDGANSVTGALAVEPSASRAGSGRDPAALGNRGDKDERNGAAPAHTPAPTAQPAAVYDAAPSAAAAPQVRAAAPVEIPQPPQHTGSARASITVGEGDDRVALQIAAHGAHVRVTASTASQQLANELNRDAGELREALRQHGLSLTEMHAGSSNDTPSQPQSQPQPRDPEGAPGSGPPRASTSPSTTATQPETATPTPARRVLA
jgi:hypothetical protein